jgi:molecular chaperone DnaJ
VNACVHHSAVPGSPLLVFSCFSLWVSISLCWAVYTQVPLSLSFMDAVHGCEKDLRFAVDTSCETCMGSGDKSGKGLSTCSACGGSGQQMTGRGMFHFVSPCENCGGRGQTIADPCGICSGSGVKRTAKTVSVKIPAGLAR